DHRGVAEILGAVADYRPDAELGEAPDVGALGLVGALHAVAEVVQDLGDPRHADAADADKVDHPDVERQPPHAASFARPPFSGARRATKSASRSAASRRPSARAAAAAAASGAG